MGLRIATNIAAISANRSLQETTQGQHKTYSRLASGKRIVEAGDDAAGLSISENLRAQVRSMTQAERNANDGVSFVQVAEGGLNEIGNILIRARELAIQAASDTIGDRERGFVNKEIQQLMQEVDRIADVTSFNGTPLLNGQSGKDLLQIQVGIHAEENGSDRIALNPNEFNVKVEELGLEGISYESTDGAREALERVDSAISKVFEKRALLGATQNKMHATIRNLGVAKENLQKAQSRIADADIAAETSELVRNNILQSAGVSVLAQANQAPMAALKLI